MPSFKSTVLAVTAAFAAAAHAKEYFIEPDSVPLSVRKGWCIDEKRICPFICRQIDPRDVLENSCDPETLTYGCLCGDGKQPNMSEFSLTLPYFVCTEAANQCVLACGIRDNECSRACREDNPCGAQNPNPPNASATADAPAPTETEDEDRIFDGLAGDEDDDSSATSLLAFGKCGLGAVLGGLAAGFAML